MHRARWHYRELCARGTSGGGRQQPSGLSHFLPSSNLSERATGNGASPLKKIAGEKPRKMCHVLHSFLN